MGSAKPKTCSIVLGGVFGPDVALHCRTAGRPCTHVGVEPTRRRKIHIWQANIQQASRKPPDAGAQTSEKLHALPSCSSLTDAFASPPGKLQLDMREPPPQLAQTFKWHCANLRLRLRKPSPLVAQTYWALRWNLPRVTFKWTCANLRLRSRKPSSGIARTSAYNCANLRL